VHCQWLRMVWWGMGAVCVCGGGGGPATIYPPPPPPPPAGTWQETDPTEWDVCIAPGREQQLCIYALYRAILAIFEQMAARFQALPGTAVPPAVPPAGTKVTYRPGAGQSGWSAPFRHGVH
jgi:hypothetical protein